MFVARLAGVGVEGGVGETVDFFVVHGEEDLARLYGGSVVGLRGDAGTSAGDSELATVGDSEFGGVVGVDFEVAVFGVELAKNFGLVRSSLGVPLATGASSGEENEGVLVVGGFR